MRIPKHLCISPSVFFSASVLLFGIDISFFSTSVYGDPNETLVQKYIETTNGIQIEYNYSVTKTMNGSILESSSDKMKETCITNTTYECRIWEYRSVDDNTQIVAERNVNTLHLVGILKGRRIDKEIEISNLPWVQFWEYGIINMLESKKSSMEYISIDPGKPEKIRTFIVKKKGVQEIEINDQKEDAIHLVITIQGIPAFIFHADYWMRSTDYVFLRSEMPQGPFAPITRFQISNQY